MRSSIAIASVCAVTLGLLELDLALAGARSYESLWAVQAGALIGVMCGYWMVFWVSVRACQTATRVTAPTSRFAAFVALGVLSGSAAFLAPLLPSAVLAAACKTEVLCPSAANPVLWSYLNLVTGFASTPSLVILVLVTVFAVQASKLGRSEHAA